MKQLFSMILLAFFFTSCHEKQVKETPITVSEKTVDSLALSLGIDENLLVEGRHIEMEGVVNFRDLGGLKTTDGKSVKWGKIYRSGKLSELTEQDLNKIKTLEIKTVIDFRTNGEAQKEPDALDSTIHYLHLPIGEDKWANEDFFKSIMKIPADSMEIFMTKLYQEIPIKWHGQYKRYFETLSNPENAPILFHCTAGKDRTGIGSALLLHTLGVDLKTIENEYVLSNYFRYEDNKKYVKMMEQNGIPKEMANQMMLVTPNHLQGVLDAITEKHGSLDGYLGGVLGVTEKVKSALTSLYLE